MRVAELQILPPSLTRARKMPRVTPTARTQQSTVSTLVVGAQWGVLSSQEEVRLGLAEFKVPCAFLLCDILILEALR